MLNLCVPIFKNKCTPVEHILVDIIRGGKHRMLLRILRE